MASRAPRPSLRLLGSAAEPSPSARCRGCQNRKRATKFPHNSFLTLVQVFGRHRWLMLPMRPPPTDVHTFRKSRHLHLAHSHQSISISSILLLSLAVKSNIGVILQRVVMWTGCVCAGDLQSGLYQPFLPAGRAPSPGGCESCL